MKGRLGLSGMRLEDDTMVCCFDLKKSRNDWRISLLVILSKAAHRGGRNGEVTWRWAGVQSLREMTNDKSQNNTRDEPLRGWALMTKE